MYKSIVVGVDGSPTAEIALDRAIELASLSGGRLHVVSAYEPAAARVAGGAPSGEQFDAPSDFKADAVLQRALDKAGAKSLEVEQRRSKGRPGRRTHLRSRGERRGPHRDRQRGHEGPEADIRQRAQQRRAPDAPATS